MTDIQPTAADVMCAQDIFQLAEEARKNAEAFPTGEVAAVITRHTAAQIINLKAERQELKRFVDAVVEILDDKNLPWIEVHMLKNLVAAHKRITCDVSLFSHATQPGA